MAQTDSSVVRGEKFRHYVSFRNRFLATNFKIHKLFNPRFTNYFVELIKDGYQLTFFDDFDTLNTQRWRLGQPWGEFHPDNHFQHFDRSQVRVIDGLLYLGCANKPRTFDHPKQKDSTVIIPYAVGLINSDISFKQKYGFFEIRCKMPVGPASWPAFWLTGSSHWPPEIDIFENYGGKTGKSINQQTSTIHWGVDGQKSRGSLPGSNVFAKNGDTLFHTFACEWTPKFIKFYSDGILFRHIPMNKKLRYFLDDEMVIIINNAIEPKFIPYLPENFTQNQLVVDWIRVYSKDCI